MLTDGHTRALAALLAGRTEVRACWETGGLDWEAYRICVRWCAQEGIRTVADLGGRVVSARDYEGLLAEHSVVKLWECQLETDTSNNLVVNRLSRLAAIKIRSSQGDLNRSHSLVGHFVGQTEFLVRRLRSTDRKRILSSMAEHRSAVSTVGGSIPPVHTQKWKDPTGERDDRLPTASWQ